MSNMQGTDGLRVQPGLLDGEGSDDQKDVPTELFSSNPVRGALIATGEMPAILRDLGLDDTALEPDIVVPVGLDDTALEPDMVVPAVPVASNRPAPTTPNIQVTVTPPYRTYRLALLAALALTFGTTRYFVTGSDASGSDTLTASTVPSVPKPPVQPVDPAFEAAKRVAEADLKRLNGFAYIPECERLATVGLTARKDELAQGHKVIKHTERPDLNVPAHVDFGVASLGQKESVLCWTQHPGFTHP